MGHPEGWGATARARASGPPFLSCFYGRPEDRVRRDGKRSCSLRVDVDEDVRIGHVVTERRVFRRAAVEIQGNEIAGRGGKGENVAGCAEDGIAGVTVFEVREGARARRS